MVGYVPVKVVEPDRGVFIEQQDLAFFSRKICA